MGGRLAKKMGGLEDGQATVREDGRTIGLAMSKPFDRRIALYPHKYSLFDISTCCGCLLRRSVPYPSPSQSPLGLRYAAIGMRPGFTLMVAHCG